MTKIIIDGNKFNDLDSFFTEANSKLCPDLDDFRHSLDALSDALEGGFGAFDFLEKIEIEWLNSGKSRNDLGKDETLRHLKNYQTAVHPENAQSLNDRIDNVKRGASQTLFDDITAAIEGNGHTLTLA